MNGIHATLTADDIARMLLMRKACLTADLYSLEGFCRMPGQHYNPYKEENAAAFRKMLPFAQTQEQINWLAQYWNNPDGERPCN